MDPKSSLWMKILMIQFLLDSTPHSLSISLHKNPKNLSVHDKLHGIHFFIKTLYLVL
jgi:hypothetical protein